jgi:hypothetical protein
MTECVRYTLWFETDTDINANDEVLASGLTPLEAAKFVREYGGTATRSLALEYKRFRAFEIHHTNPNDGWRTVIAATVPRTGDAVADRKFAQELIDIQTVDRHRELWRGQISTDEEFKKRLARIEERRAIQRLDREITTKLIDALLADGFTVSACIRDPVPDFQRSTDRDGILDLLFNLDMAELHVHRDGKTSGISLVFDESGWDVIADYSCSLEGLIDPLVEPYLPWNQPSAEDLDSGISVFVLPSSEELERGDPGREGAIDTRGVP